MHIAVVYFSATGNTKKIAKTIVSRLEELDCSVEEFDITSQKERKLLDVDSFDALFFGAPVFSSISPKLFRDYLSTLKGGGKKCAQFFTYGGFRVDSIHYNTKELLGNAGFTVVASSEYPAAHSFNIAGWNGLTKRPDSVDFELAKTFTKESLNRFGKKEVGEIKLLNPVKFSDDELELIEISRFKTITELPHRVTDSCSNCGRCADLCPTGAFSLTTWKAKEGVCIGCMSCLVNCPDKVIKVNDMSASWEQKAALIGNSRVEGKLLF